MYGTMYGMEKTTVYLTTDLKRALERAARSSGRARPRSSAREYSWRSTAKTSVQSRGCLSFEATTLIWRRDFDELLKGFGET